MGSYFKSAISCAERARADEPRPERERERLLVTYQRVADGDQSLDHHVETEHLVLRRLVL